MPKRIQLKRKKGWRMPENTIIVDRRSKYGNPFKIVGDMIYCDASHRRKIMDPWVFFEGSFQVPECVLPEVIKNYERWVHGFFDDDPIVRPREFTIEQLREELKGKNLACWCSKDNDCCHADILLEVSNA